MEDCWTASHSVCWTSARAAENRYDERMQALPYVCYARFQDVHTEWEIFAEENFAFSPEMQFSLFYFRVFKATVRVGNSFDEFS